MGGYGWLLVCLTVGAMPAPRRVHTGQWFPSTQSWWVQQTGPYWVKVKCDQSQVIVSVEKSPGAKELVKPSDLTLGDCPYTSLKGESVVFVVAIQACGSQVQLTPGTMIYRNILFYKAERPAPTTAEPSLPSAVLIECHCPRQMPLGGSRNISEAKGSEMLAKLRTAVGRQKRNVYWQQENSSLIQTESNEDTTLASTQGTVPDAEKKVVIVKHKSALMMKDPGMIMALIIVVSSLALVLFAMITQFVYQRCGG
ncbi:zona pellucida sperm-binding protein 3-like [Podarcis raffonei]|uniref:zona pellucida sperm-binding protein 3-like n=1 Tax=Podarcis raffonei TaxID=65483 RepID=UPI002329758B|nr:zona pellucida sperm-binding protein 3-like [Podarcis raffonei]